MHHHEQPGWVLHRQGHANQAQCHRLRIPVDAKGTVEFNFDEIGEALGYGDGEFTQANFEEVMSTHYGRMINLDDRTVFFANPEDAAEYLGFDLQPV
jgi:propane monooxygenase coupling protein